MTGFRSLLRPALSSPRPHRLRFAAAVLAGATCLAGYLPAQVSREVIPVYTEKLAPLLTPWDQVLKAAEGLDPTNHSGLTLASEWIEIVDAEGRRLTAHQVAYKTLTEAGVSSNAEDVFSYRKNEQKFHLISADTIQPDGTVLPVKANAILLQTPQREAEYALYDDQAEVRVIYPNVKPGSITRAIYVTEDLTARMPGEFSRTFVWDSYWPTGFYRDVIEMPAEMAERLQTYNIGSQVPTAVRETLPDGRVRFSWRRDHIPTDPDDVSPAPSSQIGPSSHVTTLASWNQIGDWFGQLLQTRNDLSPALAAKVNEWTKGVQNRDDLVRILLAKVADDVRYTGLELGEADYRPHNCNEVWENQYGDCKDKANLLVAFLRAKGIPAWMVLVNTNHLGLVDRRAPDYKVFNHAIVAVGTGKGGYLFCDPTIEYARPGMLSPSGADREVLVVKDKDIEWVRTPPLSAGSTRYLFDLKLSDTGELSGWLTLTSDGYYGVQQRAEFRRLDPDASRKAMVGVLRGFFPNVNVIDVVNTTSGSAADVDVVKAYFINPGQKSGHADKPTLNFIQSPATFVDLGHSPTRDSNFFIYRDHFQVSATIALPAGLAPGAVPENFRVETPTGSSKARWQFDHGVCKMDLDMTVTQSVISPKEFGRYYQARQSLRAWLEKPVTLSTTGVAAAPPPAETAEIDLPLMPTGSGELDLIDERYPEEGNHALRRAALARTLQYFPKDHVIAFRVGIRLASLDWNEDKNQEALDRLLPLLAGYKAEVTPESYSWGELYEALALRDLKREPEALAIFERLVHDAGLSDERRVTAAVDAADMIGLREPPRAIGLLSEVAPLKDPGVGGVYSRLIRLMLGQDNVAGVRKKLGDLLQSQREDIDEILLRIAKDQSSWTQPGEPERRQKILDLLAELVPQPGDDLKNALASGTLNLACTRIKLRLKEDLGHKPLSDWYAPVQDHTLKTFDDFKNAIAKAEEKIEPEHALQLAVQSLVSFSVTDDFPRRLWKAASYSDWKERRADHPGDNPIYSLLLDLCEQLPGGQDFFFEGRILRAEHLERMGDGERERSIYLEMLGDPLMDKSFIDPVCKSLGASYEKIGDIPHALETYRRMEPFVATNSVAANGILRATFINLHLNHPDEAERLIKLLATTDEEVMKKAVGVAQIREFIALQKSGHAAAFWAAAAQWWPAWQALAKSAGTRAEGPDVFDPVISDLTELGGEMGNAIRNNQPAKYLADLNRMASAARWLPSMGAEVTGMTQWTNKAHPELIKDVLKVNLAILEVPHPEGVAGLRNRQLYLASTSVDSRRFAETLKIAEEFSATAQDDDDVSRSLHRIWAIAALETKKDLTEAAAAIEKDLRNASFSGERASSVSLLANLYQALGKPEEQAPLLKREIEQPAIVANSSGHAALTARYQLLIGSGQLAGKVKTWISSLPLSWYELAEPATLEDPRLRDLEKVLREPEAVFYPQEQIKLKLLVAQDAHVSFEVQKKAWEQACSQLYYVFPTFDQFDRFTTSVIEQPGLGEECRLAVLWVSLVDAAEHGRKDVYARLRKHPLTVKLNPRLQTQLESVDLLVPLDQTSSAASKELAERLMAKELGPIDVEIVGGLLRNLLRLGDLAAAHELADKVPSWKLSNDVAKTADAIQLDFSRSIRAAEATAGIHEALARRVLETYPDAPVEMPAPYASFRRNDIVPATTPELTLQACLQRIKTRQFDREGLHFWGTFLRALPPKPESVPLILDLTRIALKEAQDDDQRADVVSLIRSGVDLDEPAIVDGIQKMFAAHRQPAEAPLTYSQIRLLEINLAIRHGEPVDLENAFEGLNAPSLSFVRIRERLIHYTQAGDRTALKRAIDGLDSSRLLDPDLLHATIPAFDLLGMKTEAEAARRLARRELKKLEVISWSTFDESSTYFATQLAELLGDPEGLAPGWVQAISTGSPSEVLRHSALLTDGWLHRDWTRVNEQSVELIKLRPTYYHYCWYEGMALHQLGRDPEAVVALTKYTHFAHDEAEYPAAMALLQKIAPPNAKP